LPILQVDSDIKSDIQNSVNAGYGVTIPEREITYCGWQGTGYIIQDPMTGAGACLITGGAAGAETLITEGYYVTLHEKFLEYSALVIEGEGESWLEELWVPYWNTEYNAMMAVGAIYRLGYLPIHKRITTKEWYLSQISYNCWKILYHVGHGASGSLLLDGNTRESVTTNEIAGSSTDFLFVYIDACHSAEGICQAFSSTALGWQGSVAWRYAYWFEAAFWLECLNGESVGEARRIAKDLADKIVEWLPGPKGDPEVFGDESIILSLER
ncbi:MAG: hypothetical protein KJ588_05370, partial [Gammaproteobacteria bacterium]|nr:hypothetical protein [Gammaproteobacteria bacterium]